MFLFKYLFLSIASSMFIYAYVSTICERIGITLLRWQMYFSISVDWQHLSILHHSFIFVLYRNKKKHNQIIHIEMVCRIPVSYCWEAESAKLKALL